MSRRLISIQGDGNCLFRSVSYCLFRTQRWHREIRLKVVDRIVKDWELYKHFIIGDNSYGVAVRDATDYYNIMSVDGRYGGHVELHCVSQIYPKYTFIVHMDDNSNTLVYGQGRKKKQLLFSGNLGSGHYSVLLDF